MRRAQAFKIAVSILSSAMALLLLMAAVVASTPNEETDPDLSIDSSETGEPASVLRFEPMHIITSSAHARELALAMGIAPTALTEADFMCGNGDQPCDHSNAAAVVGSAPGAWFPTENDTFALLSTGDVTTHSPILGGPLNITGGDLVRLHLGLRVPQDANCMSIDFAFYTVDLPPVTSPDFTINQLGANDTFTSQLDRSELQITSTTQILPHVVAPGNFARNEKGEVVSISTMEPLRTISATTSPVGTTYDDVFPLLNARATVTPGADVDLYLSIQDIGDALGNSAVALDNLTWSQNTTCETGQSGDTDGDGLPDGWEIHGRSFRHADGTVDFVDLPGMGADPNHKDIFVEIDYMGPLNHFDPRPITTSMQWVATAFDAAPVDNGQGIQLHIDYGPDAPLRARDSLSTGVPLTWGAADLSAGGLISPTSEFLVPGQGCAEETSVWSAFNTIKEANFLPSRRGIFHYGLFIHKLMDCDSWPKISGASSNLDYMYLQHGASDFIVSLGHEQWSTSQVPMPYIQAGTFMHELGHNLGLTHDGGTCIGQQDSETCKEHYMKKPNHLSVMNYLYQTQGGLVVDEDIHRFDYQRFNGMPLHENHLIEQQGLGVASHFSYTVGVRYHCPCSGKVNGFTRDASTVDWNCDESIETARVPPTVSIDINGSNTILPTAGVSCFDFEGENLEVLSEWDKLTLTGGLLNRQQNMLDKNVTTMYMLALPLPETGRLQFPRVVYQESQIPDQQILEELDVEQHMNIPYYPSSR